MVEASEGEGIGVSKTVSQKRQSSPGDEGERESKKRSVTIDSDSLDCPVCFEPFTIPIYQCENGHLACSTCCPKLNTKCPTCDKDIGRIRCRGLENFLESISFPCPNEGCSMNVAYGKEDSHKRECKFSPCSCPAQSCGGTGTYNSLYNHFISCDHIKEENSIGFRCGSSFSAHVPIDKNFTLKESGMRLLFAVQCFRESYGVYVTVSYIAPSNPEVGEFSYQITYIVDGETMTYKTTKMKNILELSSEIPYGNSMLVQNHFLRGNLLKMKFLIKKLH